jgi:hypothetical protein
MKRRERNKATDNYVRFVDPEECDLKPKAGPGAAAPEHLRGLETK